MARLQTKRLAGFKQASAFIGTLTVLTASFMPTALTAGDVEAVDYRRHIMKTMGEQAAAIGLVLQNNGPAENFALHADILALSARTALKAFEAKTPGGEAKAEVWKNWPDFSRRLEALSVDASSLAALARDKGLAAAKAKVMGVLTCKSCHDVYTTRKER